MKPHHWLRYAVKEILFKRPADPEPKKLKMLRKYITVKVDGKK
jgi:hypothetical protein